MASVTVKSTHGLVHEIVSGKHTIFGDEGPPEGDDEGMNAHQIMLAALGSCQAITLRLYAQRKGWDLGEVTVQLTSERIGNGKEHLESHITSTGKLDEEQRLRLEEIAGRCPISKLLKNQPELVETFTLVD